MLPAIAALLTRIGFSTAARAAAGRTAAASSRSIGQKGAKSLPKSAMSAAGKTEVIQSINLGIDKTAQPKKSNWAIDAAKRFLLPNRQEQLPKGNPEAKKPTMSEVYGRGTNFGDVMGGKITAQQAQDRTEKENEDERMRKKAIEGEEKLAEAKVKLTKVAIAATGGLATLPLAAAGLVNSVHSMSAAMIERQRGLAQYSGRMSEAFAKLEVQNIRRNMERSRATAGSTARLAESWSKLEDALMPITITMTNALNGILAFVQGISSYLIEKLPAESEIVKKLDKLINNTEPKAGDTAMPIEQAMMSIVRETDRQNSERAKRAKRVGGST